MQTIVDTKRMKTTYENDEYFRTFVKHATTQSSLPSDKLMVWLKFERNQDLTNNNQEATNSRINKDLKQTHPSPMILLCFVYKELRDAEMKAAAAVVGQPRSRQALAHKLMAERRYRLKLNYENDRRLMGWIRKDC